MRKVELTIGDMFYLTACEFMRLMANTPYDVAMGTALFFSALAR